MAAWKAIEEDAPEFARRVRARFDAGTNKTIATLRADGAPRISAIEMKFEEGAVTFGMMGGSRKLADVRRDPRVAVHCPTIEPPAGDPASWEGDAKLAGIAAETGPVHDPGPGGAFRIDITEVVLTYVGTPADHLVIETWRPARGWQRQTRE
jgi:hypothetical protein